jgi:DNA-directed RNA polymerase specialized sigma24 family protein
MSPGRTKPHCGSRDVAPQPDPDVMSRLASGDIGALGELYDRYQAPLRRFVARATSDAEDVDDLVHATFLAAAKSAGRYDGRSSCRPWLVGIAAQLLRRRRRALGRFFEVLSAVRGKRASMVDLGPMLQARSDVERALAQISEAKRITLLMAEVEGLTCAEIAAAVGVPIGTVWTRLHAARRELRRALEDREES